MVSCYVALGSNEGVRHKNIELALEYLKHDPAVKILKISSLIETKAIGGPTQPKFLNAVVKLKTRYSAQKLLKKLQEIEVRLGRRPEHLKNHPRAIDLDILLYGALIIDEDNLKIPHPEMWKREFITVPLKEIAPQIFE